MSYVHSMSQWFEARIQGNENLPQNYNIHPKSKLWESDDQDSLETDIDRPEETSRSEGNNDETVQIYSRLSSQQTKSVSCVEVQTFSSETKLVDSEVQTSSTSSTGESITCMIDNSKNNTSSSETVESRGSSKQTKSAEVQSISSETVEVKLKDSEVQTSSISSTAASVIIADSKDNTSSSETATVTSGGSSKQTKSIEVQTMSSETIGMGLKHVVVQTTSSTGTSVTCMIDDSENNTSSFETAETVHQENSEVILENSEEQISSTISSVMIVDHEDSITSETGKNVQEATSKMGLNSCEGQISLPSASVMIGGSEEYTSSKIAESMPVQDDSDDDSLVTIIDIQECCHRVGDYNDENPNHNKHQESSEENLENSEEQISSTVSSIMVDECISSEIGKNVQEETSKVDHNCCEEQISLPTDSGMIAGSDTTSKPAEDIQLMPAQDDSDDDSAETIIDKHECSSRVGDRKDEKAENNVYQKTSEVNLESSKEQISSAISSIMVDDRISSETRKNVQEETSKVELNGCEEQISVPTDSVMTAGSEITSKPAELMPAQDDSDDDSSETIIDRHERSSRVGDHNDEKNEDNKIQETSEENLESSEEQINSAVSSIKVDDSISSEIGKSKTAPYDSDDDSSKENIIERQECSSIVGDHNEEKTDEIDEEQNNDNFSEITDVQTEYSCLTESASGTNEHHSSHDSGVTADNSSEITLKGDDPIEYMVEVYLPFMKHQISIKDIIYHLHFLDRRDINLIISKHAFCASDAFELLVEKITKSDAEGKWKVFMDALKEKEYEHIRLLLERKTEIDLIYSSALLKLVSPELEKRIYVTDFMDIAYEKGLLTEQEKDEAEAQRREHGEHAGARVIIQKIDKHKEDWNTILIEILKKFDITDIAGHFEWIGEKAKKIPLESTTDVTKKVVDWQDKNKVTEPQSCSGDDTQKQDRNKQDNDCINSLTKEDSLTEARASITHSKQGYDRKIRKLTSKLLNQQKQINELSTKLENITKP